MRDSVWDRQHVCGSCRVTTAQQTYLFAVLNVIDPLFDVTHSEPFSENLHVRCKGSVGRLKLTEPKNYLLQLFMHAAPELWQHRLPCV